MIEIVPARELQVGDVFSTDGFVVSTVVLLPKTSRVFVQARLDDAYKTEALAQDFECPLWREDLAQVYPDATQESPDA
jgi:hypothetical protein